MQGKRHAAGALGRPDWTPQGYLVSYRRLADAWQAPGDDEALYTAYLERVAPQSWFNNRPSGNVMNPEAVDRFIELTHERYFAKRLAEHFGKTVPAIFTDEPHFVAKGNMNFARAGEDVMSPPLPYDFCETFEAEYGYDLLDRLPEVFWERGGRNRYPRRAGTITTIVQSASPTRFATASAPGATPTA